MAGALESIPGLLPEHLSVLVDELDIRTPGELARADRRAVLAAMRWVRPRPALEEVSRWQDAARDIAAATADPDWEQNAAFVVSFETRTTTAGPRRRVVAEQAERVSPLPRQVWPSWACGPVGEWLQEQASGDRR